MSLILGILAQSAGAVATNSYESIATVSLGSNQSTITFSSIPSTYKHLQIRAMSKTNTTATSNTGWLLRINSDTGNNYAWHQLYGNGSVAGAQSSSSTNGIYVAYIAANVSSTNMFGGTVLDVLDYASTTKNKTLRALSGTDRNGSGFINLDSGAWFNTSAINRIDLTDWEGGDFMQYSHFALYGIKD
jgi:hypothetical protein